MYEVEIIQSIYNLLQLSKTSFLEKPYAIYC